MGMGTEMATEREMGMGTATATGMATREGGMMA
jgi:hypothetical protein